MYRAVLHSQCCLSVAFDDMYHVDLIASAFNVTGISDPLIYLRCFLVGPLEFPVFSLSKVLDPHQEFPLKLSCE